MLRGRACGPRPCRLLHWGLSRSSPATVTARVGEAPSPSGAVRPCTAGDRRLDSRAGTSAGASSGWCWLAPSTPGRLARSLALSVLPPVSLLSTETHSCCPPSPRRGHRTELSFASGQPSFYWYSFTTVMSNPASFFHGGTWRDKT